MQSSVRNHEYTIKIRYAETSTKGGYLKENPNAIVSSARYTDAYFPCVHCQTYCENSSKYNMDTLSTIIDGVWKGTTKKTGASGAIRYRITDAVPTFNGTKASIGNLSNLCLKDWSTIAKGYGIVAGVYSDKNKQDPQTNMYLCTGDFNSWLTKSTFRSSGSTIEKNTYYLSLSNGKAPSGLAKNYSQPKFTETIYLIPMNVYAEIVNYVSGEVIYRVIPNDSFDKTYLISFGEGRNLGLGTDSSGRGYNYDVPFMYSGLFTAGSPEYRKLLSSWVSSGILTQDEFDILFKFCRDNYAKMSLSPLNGMDWSTNGYTYDVYWQISKK